MKNNENIVGTIVDLTHEGKGVLKKDGRVYFVDYALLGEEVEIKVYHYSQNIGYANIVKLIKPSPNRVKPMCKFFSDCGGCSLMHMNYEEQLRYKSQKVKDLIFKFAHEDVKVSDTLGMELPYNYRNKIQMPIRYNKSKQIVSGFYKPRTHDIVPLTRCLIEDKGADKILESIKKLMKDFNIAPYDEDRGTGVIRHVLIKSSKLNNNYLVVLVTTVDEFRGKKDFAKAIVHDNPNVVSVTQNINPRDTNVILGEKERNLYGPGFIQEEILGVKFNISGKSFFQTNTIQTSVLYKTAIDLAGLTGTEDVLDAYCGTGTIGLIASKHAKSVLGVEIVNDAIRDANKNKAINDITNANFLVADCETYFNKLDLDKIHYDVVFIDPPRKGCSESFIRALMRIKPNKIVYVSCDPATLARDLNIFKEDYNISKVVPVDMFPHTFHVETLISLCRK